MKIKTEKRTRAFVVLCCIMILCCWFSGCAFGREQLPDGNCTISIECSNILDNMDDLKKTKEEFVPEDGWILKETEVAFQGGETVFDVLKKVCGENGIHMSSKYTPLYKSYYIEGINQLYEMDCDKNSGWMYSVNGKYPNYGCSEYKLKDGDKIEWRYTCDLGADVGNKYEKSKGKDSEK